MSEYTVGWLASGSLLGLTVGSTFYWLGGRAGKWLRRWLGSLIIAGTVNGVAVALGAWRWQFLLVFVILVVGFHLGYGGYTFKEKLIRRTIYALAILQSGVACCFALGWNNFAVTLFCIHIILGLLTIPLGLNNPVHASAEESFVCVLLNLVLMMYPFTVIRSVTHG